MKSVRIVKNDYLDALFKLMLLSAAVHMIILIATAIVNLDFKVLNYFNILDLEIIFPSIIEGVASDVAATVVAIAIFVYFLWQNRSMK